MVRPGDGSAAGIGRQHAARPCATWQRRLRWPRARPRARAVLALLTILTAGLSAEHAEARAQCPAGTAARAVVVATGGSVTATDADGQRAALGVGDVVCGGDAVRTGADGLVELSFEGSNTTIGSHNNTTVLIPRAAADHDVALSGGLMHFISSVRELFTVRTPHQDAGIDGTEAILAVDGPEKDSLVLAREGRIRSAPPGGPTKFRITPGQASYASATVALTRATPETVPAKFRALLLDPAGASDWAVYYPPVLLAAGTEAPRLARAADRLAAGDPSGAEALLEPLPEVPRDRAAALALSAVAAVFRNRRDAGAALAADAVEADPGLGAAHIAASYARQAMGRLGAARDAAAEAVEAAPDDGFAWARLAELELTRGAYAATEAALERALALGETGLARAISGFLALARSDRAAALAAFDRAIALDSLNPLPRLGRGLALIRQGDLAEGRAELERAAALDPRRATLRTWLGRAYAEEGLGDKALAQYALAREEDPDDPSPAFFSALQLFTDNLPVAALRAVEAAREKGPARAPIRSSAGLGEDRAVGAAALGRIFDNLGLGTLATVQGAQAISADPANPDAHDFLADVLRGDQGSEIGRTSEALKADLLRQPSKAPSDILLRESDLGLLNGTGPARITFSEFAPAFDSNGAAFYATGAGGTQFTLGDEVSASVLYDDVSLSVSQLYFMTDGYRQNNDLEHQVYTVQGKYRVTPELSVFGEFRARRTEGGDRRLNFNIDEFDPTFRSEFDRDTARLGFHA